MEGRSVRKKSKREGNRENGSLINDIMEHSEQSWNNIGLFYDTDLATREKVDAALSKLSGMCALRFLYY